MRLPVAEIPTIWLDRQAGNVQLQGGQLDPEYLRWYRFAFGPKPDCPAIRARRPGTNPELRRQESKER